MATFYIQLENRLQKISGDLTHDNIIRALGYTPSDFSGNFNDLEDNPLTQDGNRELKIVDESGNIIAIVDSEGIHSIDFIAGDHKLSDKADKSEIPSLDGYATESWVENKGYAKQEDLDNIDFNTIKNTPFSDDENGELNIVDENNNIGLRLNSDGLYVKDVIAGDNILSNKVDKENGKGLSTEDFTTVLKNKLQSLSNYDDTSITEAVNSLRGDLDTLVSGDTSTAIKTFNEIIAFLEGIEDTESLSGIIASIEQQIANIEIPSLDGYATEDYVNQKEQAIQTWVNNKEFAHQDDLLNMSFNDIQDSPITENEDGEMNVVDENGNVALKVNDEGLYVKDVIAGEHILSNKMDHSEFKTINGQSILGSGDIVIEGGVGNSDANVQAVDEISTIIDVDLDKYIVETTDDNIILDNNKYYKKTNISSSISITLNIPEDNTVFTNFSIEFTTSESGTSVSLPDTIKWINGELPTFENDFTYQISICNGLGVCAKYA